MTMMTAPDPVRTAPDRISPTDADRAVAVVAKLDTHRRAITTLYAERHDHAVELHADGKGASLEAIARLYKITRERVRQIVRLAGSTTTEGAV